MYIEPTDLPVLRINVLVSFVAIPMTGLIPTVQSRECLDSDFSVRSPGVAVFAPIERTEMGGLGDQPEVLVPHSK